MPDVAESQVAELREEIRRAGGRTGSLRGLLFVLIPILVIGGMLYSLGVSARAELQAAGNNELWRHFAADGVAMSYAIGIPFTLLLAAILGPLVACSGAVFYRHARRRRFRQRLGALDPSQQAAVLLPLHDQAHADTRKLVAPLLREFGLPTEVTPASAPPGRGDEASPAAEL